jgi:hypothetical protein
MCKTEQNDFLQGWKPTTTAKTKEVEESRRVGKAIKAIPKQCWFNARKAIQKLDEYAGASLVEGWALIRGVMPIEHGWIARNGFIIDPTLPDDEMVYYPGLEFRGRAEIEHFLSIPQGKKCKKTPFFFAFGWGGMLSPSFRKCYDDVMATLNRWQKDRAAC